jgi:predicted ATPase/DNA-binding XRE family transcriptional regulator
VEKERVPGLAFGALLRGHRLAAGLSQEDLAELAQVSARGIGALERGDRRHPYRETVLLLAKALNLSPAAAAEFEAAGARPRRSARRVSPQGMIADELGSLTNLPYERTSLVGRENEISDIVRILRDERLVTITGSGGVGKTRTALAVGSVLETNTIAGVWLVELAAVGQGSFVAAAVAQALHIQELPSRPLLETLLANLEQKAFLIILDNCEHVIADAAVLADALLRGCPNLRILATSREPLRIAGEQRYRLPSLRSPAPAEAVGLTAADAREFSAVTLFAERAQSIDRNFALVDDNAPIVAEICRRLDGIPLAIELAAARLNILPVRELAAQLDRRFALLTAGSPTAMPRHQTLRALLDWSFDLLPATEQRLFERLSVFAGGCTLGAVARACFEDPVDELGVLALLASLVEKSLVVADLSGPEPRYRLLETARQYAREKLETRGEAVMTQRRHAIAYLELAERLSDTWDTVPDGAWLPSAEADMENWHAALEWAFARQGDAGDVVLGQRIAGALPVCWQHFAPVHGRRWVRAAAALVDESTPPSVVARLDYAEAYIAETFFEFKTALAAGERALAAYQKLGDKRRMVLAQRTVGVSLVVLGRTSAGEQLLSGALDVARGLGKRQIVGWLLVGLAFARSVNGDLAGARARYSEALRFFRELGAQRSAAIVALELASDVEVPADNREAALTLSLDAVAILRGLNRTYDVMSGLTDAASYLIALTRYDEARVYAREALYLALERNWTPAFVSSVQHLAAANALQSPRDLERGSDHHARSARLLGFVNARVARLEMSRRVIEQRQCERILVDLQSRFDDLELSGLLTVGAAMTDDEAIEEALSTLPSSMETVQF